jgi:four helix bundle suffix protein
MVQAARSGNKNIAEASQMSGTSKESEIKLTNVARASLEELLGDYEDYLRQRGLEQWEKQSKEAVYVRNVGARDDLTYEAFRDFIETRPAAVVANILICLIHQANYLLDQQIRRLEKDFLKEGGLRERMTRARIAARDRNRVRMTNHPGQKRPTGCMCPMKQDPLAPPENKQMHYRQTPRRLRTAAETRPSYRKGKKA